jgi:hypothetical protein
MLPAANAHFPPAILQFSSSRPKPRPSQGGASWKSMTLADLNALWPADLNATPWVARSSTVAPRVGGSATGENARKTWARLRRRLRSIVSSCGRHAPSATRPVAVGGTRPRSECRAGSRKAKQNAAKPRGRRHVQGAMYRPTQLIDRRQKWTRHVCWRVFRHPGP